MTERHARQPVDADVDVGRGLFAAGDVEIAPARCTAADEHCVVALVDDRLQAIDAPTAAKLRLQTENIADLFVDHGLWQPKFRNLGAHHAAGKRIGLVDHDFVADRQQISRDRQRRRPRTNTGDTLTVLLRGRLGQAVLDIVFVIRGDALEAANGDRLLLYAYAPA